MYIEYRFTYHNLSPESAIEFLKIVTPVNYPFVDDATAEDRSYLEYLVPNTYLDHNAFSENTQVQSPSSEPVVSVLLPQSNMRVTDNTKVDLIGSNIGSGAASSHSYDYPLQLEGDTIVVSDCKVFKILRARVALMVNLFYLTQEDVDGRGMLAQLVDAVEEVKKTLSDRFKFNIKTQKGKLIPYDFSLTGYTKRKIEVDIGGGHNFASAKCWLVSDMTDFIGREVQGYDALTLLVNAAPPSNLDSNDVVLNNYARNIPLGVNVSKFYDQNLDIDVTLGSMCIPFVYFYCRIE